MKSISTQLSFEGMYKPFNTHTTLKVAYKIVGHIKGEKHKIEKTSKERKRINWERTFHTLDGN